MNRALSISIVLLAGCSSAQSLEHVYVGGGTATVSFTKASTDALGIENFVTIEGATADELANEGGAAFLVEENLNGELSFWSTYIEIADFGVLNSNLPCVPAGGRLFVAVTHWVDTDMGSDTIELGFFDTEIGGIASAASLPAAAEATGSTNGALTWSGDPACGTAVETLGEGTVNVDWAFDSAVTATVDVTPE